MASRERIPVGELKFRLLPTSLITDGVAFAFVARQDGQGDLKLRDAQMTRRPAADFAKRGTQLRLGEPGKVEFASLRPAMRARSRAL